MGKADSSKRPATKAIEPTRFYTFAEAAECLQISTRWLFTLRDRGLTTTEVGSRIWIEGSDLIEFLRKYKTRAGER